MDTMMRMGVLGHGSRYDLGVVAHSYAWLDVFSKVYPFLEELRLKRMDVSDESLEFLIKLFHGFKVGEDEFGYMLADILKESYVNSGGMHFDSGAHTTLAFVTLRKDGEREFMFYRNPRDEAPVIEQLNKKISEMKKTLELFHALDDLIFQGADEEEYWKLLENQRIHRDSTYPVYPIVSEWIGLQKHLPQTLDFVVTYYCINQMSLAEPTQHKFDIVPETAKEDM
ncbi:hypothetical protein CQW23_07821 [Capsicum baccatum]|uniref:Carbohydrate kinase PfkB domain-containing protein n=1 Tax=Capsicum baccatum TaxID=33114 RepID=A0A2G2X7F7_CAPBA|nr:hypothetical protein CQW23_07821 [Capsicum baccatum]